MVEIRPTLPGDTWLILADLRPAEVAEFDALGVTSEECMRIGLARSNAFTMFIAGQPAGMFGLMDFGTYQVPWGVFTTVIDRHPIAFLRAARRWAEALSSTTVNYVDVRNELAVKWFEWMGFTLSEPVEYGLNSETFRQVRVH